MISYFPRYFSSRAIISYCVALFVVSVYAWKYAMPWYWILLGLVEVFGFFLFSTVFSNSWIKKSSQSFEKKLFWAVFWVRVVWIFLFYAITITLWDTPWEQPVGTNIDSYGCFQEGVWLAEMIRDGDISHYITYATSAGKDIADIGYPIFIALLNLITRDNILLSRLPNALFDAWTVILIYRLSKRNFGESIARMASIFVFLMPTMFFFASTTMKESLMVMLEVWTLERSDFFLRQRSIKWKEGLTIIFFILLMLLFRTVLAWVLALAFLCALTLSSGRLMSKGKRWITALVITIAGVMMFLGGFLIQQTEELTSDYEHAAGNFEYRAHRKDGNILVENLNKAIFVPLIVTVPFPTMIDISSQQAQQIQNGGFFIKNIMSFFCLLALVLMIINKEWKQSVMIISFFLGYLAVLLLSSYAHSGRFHQPVVPLEMIFAAYGVGHFRGKYLKLFHWALFFEIVICLGWNWFKLKGRSMV